MGLKSTSSRYGGLAIALHWSSAVAVILTFAAGFVVADINPQPALLLVHIGLGSIVFLLTLLRLVWWVVGDRNRPASPEGDPAWQKVAARAVHGALYVILVLMATSGIVTVLLSGAIPTVVAGGPVPDLSALAPRLAHGAMSKILLALFAGHVGAALWHQFVRRDHLLARMGVGRA
ncbi:MAG: cytochrome b/b6 domain-containing protein [Devosia sp.]